MSLPPWARFAYHEGGCPVIAWITDVTPPGKYTLGSHWPSHEAMVLDKRCTCGLRELAKRGNAFTALLGRAADRDAE